MYEIHICPGSEALTIRKKTKEQARKAVTEYYPNAKFCDITDNDLVIYDGTLSSNNYVGNIWYQYK